MIDDVEILKKKIADALRETNHHFHRMADDGVRGMENYESVKNEHETKIRAECDKLIDIIGIEEFQKFFSVVSQEVVAESVHLNRIDTDIEHLESMAAYYQKHLPFDARQILFQFVFKLMAHKKELIKEKV